MGAIYHKNAVTQLRKQSFIAEAAIAPPTNMRAETMTIFSRKKT